MTNALFSFKSVKWKTTKNYSNVLLLKKTTKKTKKAFSKRNFYLRCEINGPQLETD